CSTSSAIRRVPFDQCLAENEIGVALGPPFALGHALETRFFVHFRCLKIVARHPDPPHAPAGGFSDESVEQVPRGNASAMCFVDPHLLELGNAGPGIPGSDADRSSGLVLDHKTETLAVAASYCLTIVIVEIFFDRIYFVRRKIVTGLDQGTHVGCSIGLRIASHHSSRRDMWLAH